jgi:enoyl-CoA hydratase/carnithine racemase
MAVIERERRDQVEIIRFNRPEARNAVNFEVSSAVEAALDEIEGDGDVKVVVFTGNGPTFCAGADLKQVAQGKGGDIITRRGGFAGVVRRTFPKPLIAAVNGPALAGGFEVVLACDLVVAAEHATFGIPEAAKGLFAAAGGLIRLPKRIPLAIATELAITGDPIDAARAYELGLVNRVVPEDRVLDEALALAARIAQNGPLAVRNSLTMVREAVDLPEEQAWARSMELALGVFASKDAIEGATAFAEKRAPRWTGS